MPRYAATILPPTVEPFVDMFGASKVRVAILLDLTEHPGSTRAEIVDRLNLNPKVVLTTLQSLAQQGIVSGDGPRGRLPAHYTADVDAVRDAIAELGRKFQ